MVGRWNFLLKWSLFEGYANFRRGLHLGRVPWCWTGDLKSRELRPTSQSYGATAIQTEWRNSIRLLRECHVQVLETTVIWYNSVISSLAYGQTWCLAVDLFSNLLENGLECTSITYNAGIAACSNSAAWRRAWCSLKEMTLTSLQRSIISYTSAIALCGAKLGVSWNDSHEILADLCRRTLQPNVVSFTSVISDQNWRRALSFYISCRKMQAGAIFGGCVCNISWHEW